jgi:hypothetical protein
LLAVFQALRFASERLALLLPCPLLVKPESPLYAAGATFQDRKDVLHQTVTRLNGVLMPLI